MSERVASAVRSMSEEVSSLEWADVPELVRERLRMVLFDTLGVMVAGARSAEIQAFAAQFSESGSAPLVGLNRRTTIESSCSVNGASVCALELDEGNKYARGHPGAHTIPAAIAVADAHTGTEWLSAVLAGYEVAARFGSATRLADGVHPHGTWGVTGAAAVTSRLFGLDAHGIATAIDTATGLTLAPPFESALTGHPVRNLWVGAANVNGVVAARIAASGLGDVRGIASSTYGGLIGVLDEESLAPSSAGQFQIMHGYFKRHASCAYTHAPADAALKIRETSNVAIDAIASVSVETYSAAAALNRVGWPTRLAALFSVPFVVAVILRDGRFDPSSSDLDHRQDRAIGDLARRITVVSTDEFDAGLPERRGARVRVVLRDGTEESAAVEETIGDSAHQPLGWNELRIKVSDLVGSIGASDLEQAVRGLDDGPVSGLIDTIVEL